MADTWKEVETSTKTGETDQGVTVCSVRYINAMYKTYRHFIDKWINGSWGGRYGG